mgnify:CR=1 FL=1
MTRPGAADPAHPLGTKSTATGAAYKDDPHLARYWGDRGCSCTFAYIDLGFYPSYGDETRIWAGYGWVLRNRDPGCSPHNQQAAGRNRSMRA